MKIFFEDIISGYFVCIGLWLIFKCGPARFLADRFRELSAFEFFKHFSEAPRTFGRVLVLASAVLSLAIIPGWSQEKASREATEGMSPEVAQDLIAILGDDIGRVTGLPLKLVVDPKGKWVYLPETNGNVAVYDTDTLRRVSSLHFHDDRCLEVAIVEGGRKMVSIAVDGIARLWSISSDNSTPPAQLDELKISTKSGWLTMSHSQDGGRFVFRSEVDFAIVDVRDGKFVVRKHLTAAHDFLRKEIPFHYVLSPNGNWLVTCEHLETSTTIPSPNSKPGQGAGFSYHDASLVLWDVTQAEPARVFECEGKAVENLLISSDSRHVYAVDPFFITENRTHEWQIQDRKLIPKPDLETVKGRPFSSNLVFSSDGRLMGRNHGRGMSVTETVQNQVVSRGSVGLGQRIFSAAFVGDDILIVADKLLQRWDWRDDKYHRRMKPSGHQSSVMGLYFTSAANSLVSYSNDATLEWNFSDLANQTKVAASRLPWKSVNQICSWPMENGFIIESLKEMIPHIIGIVRSNSGEWVEKFSIELTRESEYDNCWCIAAHPTEPLLATGHHNHKVFLWDISVNKPTILAKWDAHSGHVCNLSFSPDGSHLASVSWDHKTTLWPIDLRQIRGGFFPKGAIIGSHVDIVRSVAWSPDGKYVASGGEDGQVLLWKLDNGVPGKPRSLMDPTDGEPRRDMNSPRTVGSLSFSRSSGELLSSDGRGRVCIWSVEKGEQLKKWQLSGWVWRAIYSPDESMVAAANNDGTIFLLRSPKALADQEK